MRDLDEVLVALGNRLTREGWTEEVADAIFQAFPRGANRSRGRKLVLLTKLRLLALRRGFSPEQLAAFDR